MRSIARFFVFAAAITPVVQGCQSTPRPPAEPHSDGKCVIYVYPPGEPQWFNDLRGWLEKHPSIKGKPITSSGEGEDLGAARRAALDAAVASSNVPEEERGALTLLETWTIGYDDGSYTVNALYEYVRPGAAEALDEGARSLCNRLFEKVSPTKRADLKTVAVGDFTYKNTGFGSEFGDLFRTALLAALQEHFAGAAVGREDLLWQIKGDAGLVMEVLDPDTLPDGRSDRVPPFDALITGTFWPTSDEDAVLVQASMKESSTPAVLGGASVSISTKRLVVETAPTGVDVAQQNAEVLNNLRERIRFHPGGKQNFELRIWPADARRVWKQGEKFRLHFFSERDCHLNIFDVQADGSIVLLFPNRWHTDTFVRGGREYVLPGRTMDFDWIIRPPFGVDTIFAVATAVDHDRLCQYRDACQKDFRIIGEEGIRGIEVVSKKIGSALETVTSGEKAEAVLALTTVNE